MNDPDRLVTILAAGSTEADLARVVLEAEGIPVFLHGEFIGMTLPYAAAPAGAGAVRVQVPASRACEARGLLDRLQAGRAE